MGGIPKVDFASPNHTREQHRPLNSSEHFRDSDVYLRMQHTDRLNNAVLQATVQHLPKLRSLHIVHCMDIDYCHVLEATSMTPLLESLAFTTSVTVPSRFRAGELDVPS